MQLAFLCVFVILLTIAGSFFEERGTILTAFIVSYALTSFLGGFFGGGLYARNSGWCYVARPFCSLRGATVAQSFLTQWVSTSQSMHQNSCTLPFTCRQSLNAAWFGNGQLVKPPAPFSSPRR